MCFWDPHTTWSEQLKGSKWVGLGLGCTKAQLNGSCNYIRGVKLLVG